VAPGMLPFVHPTELAFRRLLNVVGRGTRLAVMREGARPDDLDRLERHTGLSLPEEVRRVWAVSDGTSGDGLFGGGLASVAEIRALWDFHRATHADFRGRVLLPIAHGDGVHALLVLDPRSRLEHAVVTWDVRASSLSNLELWAPSLCALFLERADEIRRALGVARRSA